MKTSRKKSTIYNLVFEYISVLVVIVQGFVLVPLYLKYIPVDLYGAWLATGAILSFITVIDPGVSMVLLQKVSVAHGEENYNEVSSIFTSGLIITTFVVIGIALTGYILTPFLTSILNLDSSIDSESLIMSFQVAIIGTALTILSFSISATNRGLQASLIVGMISLTTNIIAILITVYLLLNGFGLISISSAILVRGLGLTVGNILCLYLHFRAGDIPLLLSIEKIREILSLMIFSFWGRIGVTITGAIDSLAISRYLGADVVPVYMLSRRGPDTCRVFVERPSTAFLPAISQLVGEGNIEKAREVIIRLIKILIWSLSFISCAIIIFNDDFISLWIGDQYFVGSYINWIIALTFFFVVFTRSCANFCLALGDIKNNNLVLLLESIIFVIFIAITIKPLGLYGVALAPLVAIFGMPIIYYPYTLIKRASVAKGELIEIVLEFIYVVIVVTILLFLFSGVLVSSWLELLVWVGIYSLCYVMAILLLSNQARNEGWFIVNKSISACKRIFYSD